MRFDYDSDANALAISLREGTVARTEQIDSGTLVDLDASDHLLTIEVLSPARRWPLDQIADRYGIGDADLRVLRAMFTGRGAYAFTKPAVVTSDNREVELVA